MYQYVTCTVLCCQLLTILSVLLWFWFQSENTSESGDRSSKDIDRFEVACNKLASQAVLRLSGDNVTVLLLAIKHNSTRTDN